MTSLDVWSLRAHDLQQFHHVGGGEEVQADHRFRAVWSPRRDLVDVQRARCWWPGSRRGLQIASSLVKMSFLMSIRSNTRLDHEVHVGEGGHIQRAGEIRPMRTFDLGSWGSGRSWRCAHSCPRTTFRPRSSASCFTSTITYFDAGRWRSSWRCRRPMVPAPMMPTLLMGMSGVSSGTVGDFVGHALGEEAVALGGPIAAPHHQLAETACARSSAPSSKGWFTAASMQRMLYSGARKARGTSGR